jgi:CheY-like chemotaxis protein
MKPKRTLLIADRNRNVRAFLAREFRREGLEVTVAADHGEVLRALRDGPFPDLLILDPDIPSLAQEDLLQMIRNIRPEMPIVVHSLTNEPCPGEAPRLYAVMEKRGNNLESLKRVVSGLLGRPAQGNAADHTGEEESPSPVFTAP